MSGEQRTKFYSFIQKIWGFQK